MMGDPFTRVLFVDEFHRIGGAEKVMLAVMTSRAGKTLQWGAVINGPGTLADALQAAGATVFHADFQGTKNHWTSRRVWQQINGIFSRVVSEFKPDIIIANSLWAYCLVRRSAITGQIPVICAVHAEVQPKRHFKKAVFKLFSARMLKPAAGFFAVSPGIADEIRSLGVPENKIRVIPNGIDLARFCPGNRHHDARSGLIIGTTGRLHPGKGQDTFLKIAATLAVQFPTMRFWIAGEEAVTAAENQGFTQHLRAMIRDLGLHGKVDLLGFCNDIPGLLANTDILISTSREESFGLSVLEAMACGLPVVVSDVGGLKTLVEHNQTGFLIDPDDVPGYVSAVVTLAGQPDTRKSMGQAARKKAMTFSSETMTGDWIRWMQYFFEGTGRRSNEICH